jgi:hypothetical protein
MKVTASVVRLTICKCGFPVLNESIGLGQEYIVDIETIRKGYQYFCGGCKTMLNDITVISASQTKREGFAALPYDLFFVDDDLQARQYLPCV